MFFYEKNIIFYFIILFRIFFLKLSNFKLSFTFELFTLCFQLIFLDATECVNIILYIYIYQSVFAQKGPKRRGKCVKE